MKIKNILVFFLGALCFIVAQPLLRIPLLNLLQQSTQFTLFYRLNPIFVGVLIASSAGIFEEGFRFLFKLFLLKPIKSKISQPILFGLGHGIAEAFIVLGPYLFTVSFADLRLAFIERVLAIILHVGLTVIIWNGFQLNQKGKYLLIAIFVHGFTNALIPLLSGLHNAVIWIEGALLLIDIIILGYIYKSRKIYKKKEENE